MKDLQDVAEKMFEDFLRENSLQDRFLGGIGFEHIIRECHELK